MPLVIFVDDSDTALASTRTVTSDMPIEVRQYICALDALNDIQNSIVIPDLIITDLNMPVMDGMQFLKALRELDATKRTPVLMLTTEARDELKHQGKVLGLTGWILKPFNSFLLKTAISRILRIPV